jgi:centriolar satellite-associated tubulin polyglutamylase complex regulator 1
MSAASSQDTKQESPSSSSSASSPNAATAPTVDQSLTLLTPDQLKEMSDKEYLSLFQVREYLSDATALLLNSAANDRPLQFFHTYFQNVTSGEHVLFREFKFISATPYNRRCFLRIFRGTYRSLPSEHELSLFSYHQLLTAFCSDFPFSLLRNASRISPTPVSVDDKIKFGPFTNKLSILFLCSGT